MVRAPARRDAAADLYVHVAGAVRAPGLIRRAAGHARGYRTGQGGRAASARRHDPRESRREGSGRPADRGAREAEPPRDSAPLGEVHLSSATAEQLDEVDGIGPTLAKRIIEYRDAHGGFGSIDELAQVDGIGEKRLATLRDALQP